MKTLFHYALYILLIPQLSLAALSPEEIVRIRTELREAITLQLKNGQSIQGFPTNVSENTIQLNAAEGAGEIIYRFEKNEILEIQMPGESYKSLALEWAESGQETAALDLMDLLYAQRAPLISYLPPAESNFFIIYTQLILDSPNPARAIAVTERLKPQIENTAAIEAIDDAILKSYHILELDETATELAEAWVATRNPYGASALGYYVLGVNRLRNEAYEEALDLALRPIAFSTPLKTEQLEHCYALAISAAFALRDPDYAIVLYADMNNRGFRWPAEEKSLQPYHEKLLKKLNTDASTND
ncbi:MAG: hypothetical protein AAGC73_05410 [Verrucomicrobiota bacterium]